jgi:phage-related protein
LTLSKAQFIFARKKNQNASCPNEQLKLNLHKMNEAKKRLIIFYQDYFSNFYLKQRQKVKDKILWTLRIIETQEIIPHEYFRFIENSDGLYEIRVSQGNDIFRIFCFFDKGNLIVLANGFQKKSQKTPRTEIQKAIAIKKLYENEK